MGEAVSSPPCERRVVMESGGGPLLAGRHEKPRDLVHLGMLPKARDRIADLLAEPTDSPAVVATRRLVANIQEKKKALLGFLCVFLCFIWFLLFFLSFSFFFFSRSCTISVDFFFFDDDDGENHSQEEEGGKAPEEQERPSCEGRPRRGRSPW